ncbi:MAG: methyltransferase domain-containing protein, partial [Candidatus Latescibacteria bacterium]|nr:methyltransferase domain-containing protein [Candidatus Latescibacterota bacterium]
FTSRVGEDRVTPGTARSDIFLHHAKRYVFASQFCSGKRVLDVGCGTGYGAKVLAGRAAEVVGLDLSSDAAGYGNRTYGAESVRRLVSDGRSIALKSGLFDVAVCFEMIEHIVEHDTLLEELKRLLRPGGILVVSTPNKRIYDLPENDNPYHIGMLERDEFQDLLGRHFGSVRLYGQMRPQPGDDFYRMFDFREMARDEDEIFVAICSERTSEAARETRVQGEPPGEASAVEEHAGGPPPEPPSELQRFLQSWAGPVRLNLGCGEDRREGYINVDAFVATADLKMDIFDLEFGDESVDEILSSHMLEHLSKHEVPRALSEWCRVLRPGGCLKLNLPDLEWAAQQWLATPEKDRWGWPLDTIFGLQTHPGEYHRTGFTVARIEQLLAHAGFTGIRASWIWSHGQRCLWAEAERTRQGGGAAVVDRPLDPGCFETQFIREMSDLVPYPADDCSRFLDTVDWRIELVSFERLPSDGADYTVNVAVKGDDRQMVLQGLRVFNARGDSLLSFPDCLMGVSEDARRRLGDGLGQALGAKLSDPDYEDGTFVITRFGNDGDLGLEPTGGMTVPGLTDYSLYIPHAKRYLLAQGLATGARVLDAGCGTGYGAKFLARVADRVDAVDVSTEAIAFAQKTYSDDRITWHVGDFRSFDMEAEAYDLVTCFEVIEHLDRSDIDTCLAQIARALKPGGTALISTPNKAVSAKWDSPRRHGMTRDEFESAVRSAFGEITLLGQTAWSESTEVPGQCTISGRVLDDDDMYVAVCRKVEVDAAPVRSTPPRVSIIMPLYNRVEFTVSCLEALEQTTAGVPCELILVDNGSSDGTVDLLDRVEGKVGKVGVIRNGENLGFAKANNRGAGDARGEFLLFLNNDTVPHPGWLSALVSEIEADPQVGIVGAKLLYPATGRIQHAGIELINGLPDHVFRNVDADDPRVSQPRDLDMVTGACLMIRRDLFERLNGFDEGYLNGVEDVDLCLRTRDAGYRVRYCPASVLDHHEGTSEGRYDHVRPNLQRLVDRWGGRFDSSGRFTAGSVATDKGVEASPGGDAAAPEGGVSRAEVLRGCWEGTQFVYHSLSLVNMAFASALIRSGACELKLIPFEPASFGPEVDPERYGPISERLDAELSGPAQFHVRHRWPPDFRPPPSGHWVMMQPWEFGRIPLSWVRPIQEGLDEVWVPSRYARQCYVDSGIDPDRVHVIPNGVRTELFRPGAEPIELPSQKGFRFLFVGGTIFRKGIDVLLETYRNAFTRDDDVCLVIKGTGDDTFYGGQTSGDAIRAMADDPEAPDVIYLTDELTDSQMAGLFTACDCLVHPYRGEGFGLPVAEAMACGLPVIVTQGGACDDFCAEDRAYFVSAARRRVKYEEETAGQAWLLEPDVDGLAAQMRAVVEDPDAARQKGEKASAYVRTHLTWEKSAERVIDRLRDLLKKPIKRDAARATAAGPTVDAGESGTDASGGAAEPPVDVILMPSGDTGDRESAVAALERYSDLDLRLGEVPPGEEGLVARM